LTFAFTRDRSIAAAAPQEIALAVPGRNHTQCLQRWSKVLTPGLRKGPWSVDEDNQLIAFVARGVEHWGDIAENIQGRT
jgi:myb proto-oncogene protein